MKILSRFLPAISCALLCVVCDAEETKPLSGDQLIDNAIKQPGEYAQMCFAPTVERDVPIPIYGIVVGRGLSLSKEDLDVLRAQRAVEFLKTVPPGQWKVNEN